jgi:hypothetical protein
MKVTPSTYADDPMRRSIRSKPAVTPHTASKIVSRPVCWGVALRRQVCVFREAVIFVGRQRKTSAVETPPPLLKRDK